MPYYLYIVSCPVYAEQHICKIGCTNSPHDRIRPYFTSYPPGLPQYDIRYYKLWEIDADNDEDMKDQEEMVHDEFAYQRLVRVEKSEWFQIKNFLEVVSTFIETQLNGKLVNLPELERKKQSPLETVIYKKNKKLFIRKEDQKNIKLNQIQEPVIQAIQEFITSEESAGQLIAPCGSGKTRMTCQAIANLKRIVICVPSIRIQEQWYQTIGKECVFVGGDMNNWNVSCLNSNEFCIITTYASCKKLVDILPDTTELIVFDEAHHMVGMASAEGEGITRNLLKTLVDRKMKRLFLTFTPKDADMNDDLTILSMNDETVFGKVIYELKLRQLINEGVLPDYMIWALSSEGKGLESKREQIRLAWNSNEIHHLIIFVENLKDKDELKQYFQTETVFTIDDSTDAEPVIEKYTKAERAIIIDCRRLGEGVDIPIADSVAIMYPKGSTVDIIQTILRPGRWYYRKSIFHILIPHTIDEDMSAIQTVLINLAKYDHALRGELLFISSSKTNGNTQIDQPIGFSSDHCNVEIITSNDIEKMTECFQTIRSKLVSKTNKKLIQKLCIERNIKTSKEYDELRKELTHFPEDPRFASTTWFDFLNPDVEKISLELFIQNIVQHNKRLPKEYTEWAVHHNFMSLENIRDGYFGEEKTNFLELIEKYTPLERRRR